jgi:hypothetical protein
MRFDLEFNIVSQLSAAGLSELAEIFYGEDGNKLTPTQWDTVTLIDKANRSSNAIDTSRYTGLVNVPSWLYSSGVLLDNDLTLSRLVARNNMIVPLFTTGSVFFNKYEFKWSNNTIRKQFTFDRNLNLYACKVDADINKESIQAFTLRFKYPGYVAYEKIWKHVEFINDTNKTLKENLDITFTNSKEDYKLTMAMYGEDTYVFLSGKMISVDKLQIGTAYANKGNIMAIGEYPISQDGIVIDSYNSLQGEYKFFSSTMVFKNITSSDIDIKISYEITPILTYNQLSRTNTSDDIIYASANIIPSAIGFKNGIIAIHNTGSAGGTITTDQGNNIIIPTELELIVDKSTTSVLDSVKATAKLLGIDGMPVKDAKIRFKINSTSDDVKFLESGSSSYSTFTGIDGHCTANAFIDRSRFGWYLQKEWINGNKINVPFDIKTSREDEIYLYFITSDDPILGKLFNRDIETPLTEYYSTETSIEGYEVSGRKVAYVKMHNRNNGGSNVIYSAFVKPKSVIRDQSFGFIFKDLYIKNSSQAISSFLSDLPQYVSINSLTPSVSYTASSLGYAEGILPNNILSFYSANTTDGTIIEFNESIPAYDNIVGYWLITGSSSDVTISAVFEDRNSFITLRSNDVSISTTNYIKSEYEFILTDSDVSNQNTALSAFGYYTVSEYLENPYKQSACTYTCTYCNPILKKCTFSNNTYDAFYKNDGLSGICIKPAQNNTLELDERCPITTAKFLSDIDGNLLFEQELVNGTLRDIWKWTNVNSYMQYNGKEPHIAFWDESGDITDQSAWDLLVTNDMIIPLYKNNTNYDPTAWGFINPFIMHAERA